MASDSVDIRANLVTALRTQAKEPLLCPFCSNQSRMFQNLDQIFDHAEFEHASTLQSIGPTRARAFVREEALKVKAVTYHSSEATAGGASTPDLGALSLGETSKGRTSPYSEKKRPADTVLLARREKFQGPTEIYDPALSSDIPHTVIPERVRPKRADSRLFDPKYSSITPEPSSEWSVAANQGQLQHSQRSYLQSPRGVSPRDASAQPYSSKPHYPSATRQRQPGIIEIQRFDTRYPGLLLQPDSRPTSQEQLASEVKSIYAGLTMVETKCLHVDRAQAAAVSDSDADPNSQLATDHWQALIALHRTLLHKHHDFFLASQHPSASPALRRLASKYSMPARMWKHGIHSFLELLRRRLPESIDYVLAFIYLAYQMMALLYETVPALEDTWIECLGDLGRYRMAIEDEDFRDRETWAGVTRSWYSKATDRNPTVGRLYHHLAILARPNALQQLYYYSRSLTCVRPFPSARESILTLLDPILGKPTSSYSHAIPIDTSFFRAHGLLFEKHQADVFDKVHYDFYEQLETHIGRVSTKWKDQGVYVTLTNSVSLFEYAAEDSILSQILLQHSCGLARERHSKKVSTTTCEDVRDKDQKVMYPSPTAVDDFIPLLLWEKERDRKENEGVLQKLCHHTVPVTRLGSLSSTRKLTWAAPTSILRRLTAMRISLLSKRRERGPSMRFSSALLPLNIFVSGVAGQGADTATNSDWRKRVLDTLTELVIAAAALMAPTIILMIIGGIAIGLLRARAEGALGFFVLFIAIVYAGIHPESGSTTKANDQYTRLAVGLGYIMMMLAYCRVVTMKPKHRRASNARGRNRGHGRIFSTIATVVGIVFTAVVMAFSGCREHWEALTVLHPTFAVFLMVPLSFFFCELVYNIGIAVYEYENE